MPGWGGYQPRAKSQEQMAVERRSALVAKFGAGDISELVAIAARTKKKPKMIPYSPPSDLAEPVCPEVPQGPCQDWVENQRAWRVASKTARPVVVAEAAAEPYVSDREQKLRANREYHRQRDERRKKKAKA
jgi:hypothetical protein